MWDKPPQRLIEQAMADAIAHAPPDSPARRKPRRLLLRVLLMSAGFRCGLLYRLGHHARLRLGIVGVAISKVTFWFGRHWYGCSIAPTAEIGGGLILPHPQGIVIGAQVVIGEGCWIFQNVTIGGSPGCEGQPGIGVQCRIFAGAVISGGVVLGDQVHVGANAVVVKSAGDGARIRPASTVYVSE